MASIEGIGINISTTDGVSNNTVPILVIGVGTASLGILAQLTSEHVSIDEVLGLIGLEELPDYDGQIPDGVDGVLAMPDLDGDYLDKAFQRLVVMEVTELPDIKAIPQHYLWNQHPMSPGRQQTGSKPGLQKQKTVRRPR